jgi:hypothetical protein
MRAACGWERGRSGQGKYNEEACRCGGVSAREEGGGGGGGAGGCGREKGREREGFGQGRLSGGEIRTDCAVVLNSSYKS